MRGSWTFRRRIVTTTALAVGGLVAVVGVLLHLLLDATAARDVDQVLRARAASAVTQVETASRGRDRLQVPSHGLEPGVRIYDASGDPIAGALSPAAERDAAALVATGRPQDDGRDDDVRVLAAEVRTDRGVRGTVVVAQDTDPYERSEGRVTLAIVVLGALATAIAAFVAGRVARQALAPVTVMAERAAEWSARDLGRRFGLGEPRDELTTLAATLDHLLDRVAGVIRSEQRLTAELAHELRTPLAGIQGSADLALLRARTRGLDDELRDDLEAISASARAMGEVVTTLLDLARRPGAPDASCLLADVVARLRVPAPEGVGLEVDLTAPHRIAGPVDVVATALRPLIENAVRHARSSVAVTCAAVPGAVVVRVVDDGAGLAPGLRDRIFEAGASATDGTGLGLGIARRAARSIGGEVGVVASGPGRATVFELRLPTLPLSPGGS